MCDEAIPIESLKKLRLRDGDVVLVKSQESLSADALHHVREAVFQIIKNTGKDCQVVVLENLDIEVISPEEDEGES